MPPSPHIVKQYNLNEKVKGGFVYLEIRRTIYGLPQAGILANKQLREKLLPADYYEVAHTPGLWHHVTRPIQFTLVVDDFGIKYEGKKHLDHLIAAIRTAGYGVEVDEAGSLYCGITLKWNYEKRYVDISMPGYVKKILARFKHDEPSRPQYSPYQPPSRKYGTESQETMPQDITPKVNTERIKRIQQVVGGVLYYARAVDCTVLAALSSIASEQSEATEGTEKKVKQLLDYLTTRPSATVRYHASEMVLNIHSDASYLSETRARSRVAGYYFMGGVPKNGQLITLNGNIFYHTYHIEWKYFYHVGRLKCASSGSQIR